MGEFFSVALSDLTNNIHDMEAGNRDYFSDIWVIRRGYPIEGSVTSDQLAVAMSSDDGPADPTFARLLGAIPAILDGESVVVRLPRTYASFEPASADGRVEFAHCYKKEAANDPTQRSSEHEPTFEMDALTIADGIVREAEKLRTLADAAYDADAELDFWDGGSWPKFKQNLEHANERLAEE